RESRRPGTPDGRAKLTWHRPAEELAALFFTSGTTGEPKGCMVTHSNLCWQLVAVANRIQVDPTCRFASILPLSHLFELTGGLLYPIARGAAVHYIPSRRGPDILRVLRQQRITHMMVVPQLLTMVGQALDQQLEERLPALAYLLMATIANHIGFSARRRLYFLVHRKLGGHLRMFVSGGAALPVDTQRLWERLGVHVIQGYGASECSPSIALSMPDGSTPIGNVGRPLDGMAV